MSTELAAADPAPSDRPATLLPDATVRRGRVVVGWAVYPALLSLALPLHGSLGNAELVWLLCGLGLTASGVHWLHRRRGDARVVVGPHLVELHSGLGDPEVVARNAVLAVGTAPLRASGPLLVPVLLTPDGEGVAVRPLRRTRPADATVEAARLAAALGVPLLAERLAPFGEPHSYRVVAGRVPAFA